jgi:hypothetical protein
LIEALAARDDVARVCAPPVGHADDGEPPTRFFSPEEKAIRLDAAQSLATGEGVVVGIIDDTFKVLHDAFTYETTAGGQKVRKTRIMPEFSEGAAS